MDLGDTRAACNSDEGRALVDASYDEHNQHATRHLRALCRSCPIAAGCLDWAMVNPEYGVWGGTTPNERSRHGGASAAWAYSHQRLSGHDRP